MVPYGQLIREDNQPLDKTYKYDYNGIGNLTYVHEYAYTAPSVDVVGNGRVMTFTYSDNNNPDCLSSYGNNSIDYHDDGHPYSYGNKHFSWSFDNKLLKYFEPVDSIGSSSSESTEFEYNAFGQRILKEYVYNPGVDYSGNFLIGTTSEYTYDHAGRLIREFTTDYYTESASETRELVFLYDESSMVGFTYSKNGATATSYYYHRNLFGDVIGIYNTSGTKIAGYNYDAWGNHTVVASTVENRIIANANPIRYRGYYFDSDTGLYYLNARYYSPEWRRFISPADASTLNPQVVNGLNLYSYAGNNPVSIANDKFKPNLDFNNTASAVQLNSLITFIEIGRPFNHFSGLHWKNKLGSINSLSFFVFSKTKSALVDGGLSIYKGSLYFDEAESHSIYIGVGNVSAFIGYNVKEDKYGVYADANVLSIGYDGRYIDAGISAAGVGFILGWEDGRIRIKIDPPGWFGLDISIDFGQILKDIFG